MKKVICWLMAMASFAALADAAATFQSLAWSVPAESVSAVKANYVNLYAEVDGVRVGSDGRSSFDGAAVETATCLVGEGGWDWSGKDITQATFAVEFLNSALGVIATSTPVSYAELVEADALTVNYSGSGVPVSGIATYSFAGVKVDSDGIWEELKSIFGDNAKVVPVADAAGNIVSHTVTLANNMQGAVVLKGNLGAVTIDLNDYSILGTNAVNGADVAGGNAIEVAGLLDPDTGKVTTLTICNTGAKGYTGTVAGGKGADGETGTAGGYAVAVADGITGVTVTIDGAKTVVKGGDSGNSTTGTATAGTVALYNATGDGTAGQDGTAQKAWAWAKCTYSGELPAGTTQVGETLYFWKRVNERATFDFGALAGQTVTDNKVYFINEKILVDTLTVPASAGDLTFVGQDATILSVGLTKSAFDVTSSDGLTRAWTNLVFQGEVSTTWDGEFCSDGAGILVNGGAVKIQDCQFEGCCSGQNGGAVCAYGLAAASEIVDTTFTGNGGSDINAAGGALYASAKTAGVALTVKDCAFTANEAENGGAICTETELADYPIALVIENSSFADNVASWTGGAIDAEGNVSIDATATYLAPGTTTFTNNVAAVGGGAIELNGIVGDWDGVTVTLGRGVVFVDNVVSNGDEYVSGGAIDAYLPGTTIKAEGVAFVRNLAYGSGVGNDDLNLGVYGGAVNSYEGTNTFDTCVFDGNKVIPVQSDNYFYGGALELESCETLLKNCTFRNANTEAVDVFKGSIAVTNCVLVGNSVGVEGDYAGIDFSVDGATADVAYSAWGKFSGAIDGSYMNLTNRTTAIYASDDSLHLNETGFNPVAAIGLVQPGVYDFDAVEYGSKPSGWAMGAFEAYTAPVVVNMHGTKTYDGFATSNGTVWTDWALTDTNGTPIVWEDLAAGDADLASLFTITAWDYGNKNAGEFAKTLDAPQDLTATFEGATEAIRYWMAQGFVTFDYTGTIERRDIALGGMTIELAPNEYPWTGNPVLANLIVTDTLPTGGETMVNDVDQALSFANNVNPTASAVVTVDTLRNYIGVTNLTYAITAYFIEYTYDDVVAEDLTKTYGETSGVAVAVAETDIPAAPAKFCLDYQYSYTNDVVRRYDHADGLVRLQVRYCTDANEDQVPDKYQRQILAKVANGEWKNGTGSDQTLYVTLTNAVSGKWDASGTGALTDESTAGMSLAGDRARGGFKKGGWLVFENGALAEVADPAAYVFKAGQIPFLIYAYLHDVGGSSGSGRGSGRGGKGTDTPVVTQKTLLEQYSALMTVKDATFTSDTLKLKTQLIVRDNVDGSTLTDIPTDGSVLRLYVTEKLGPEENWVGQDCVTEDGGIITVDLKGDSAFYKVGL